MPARRFKYDVFLSHNRAQKDWTRELAIRLRDAGFNVWFDEWSLRGGEVGSIGMERGLEESRHVVLVLSPEFIVSEWTDYETQIALLLSPANRDRKLIPILHTKCDLPPRISRINWIDFSAALADPVRYEFRLAQLMSDLNPNRYERPTDFAGFQARRQNSESVPSSLFVVRPNEISGLPLRKEELYRKPFRPDGSYDVFLSHSHADAHIVESLGSRLEDEADFKVWLDKWILVPGSRWQQDIAKGLEEARTCAVCIGKNTAKGWFREEIEKALNRQAKNDSFRVIPVILPGGDYSYITDFLELRTWVEFKDAIQEPEPFHLLTCGIKGISPGRFSHTPKENLDDDQTFMRERLARIRVLRKEQLIDEDIALEYQRKILDESLIGRGKK